MNVLNIKLSDDQLKLLAHHISEDLKINTTHPDKILNKKEICAYLNVSNNTLDNWILKGLPVIKIGRIRRFSKNDVVNWLKER
ncbi:helix-turn-helix transcriptional regulator [Vagococcus lutrae]|uniref:helix-turn-helix transcriptional regulator n=1 Tax=Vagococcus lutrae TaxID=81947 RepID=UPI0020108032|nr:helix-turn-helix domain-containing protein [Vagococcus lutrae]MDT2824177.1 helix-turn-helix domain-containing protein [Vagococcus lutrae]UQF18320.1 helix-turn-helix domain-containing protein [Vagococcus lutrae]